MAYSCSWLHASPYMKTPAPHAVSTSASHWWRPAAGWTSAALVVSGVAFFLGQSSHTPTAIVDTGTMPAASAVSPHTGPTITDTRANNAFTAEHEPSTTAAATGAHVANAEANPSYSAGNVTVLPNNNKQGTNSAPSATNSAPVVTSGSETSPGVTNTVEPAATVNSRRWRQSMAQHRHFLYYAAIVMLIIGWVDSALLYRRRRSNKNSVQY